MVGGAYTGAAVAAGLGCTRFGKGSLCGAVAEPLHRDPFIWRAMQARCTRALHLLHVTKGLLPASTFLISSCRILRRTRFSVRDVAKGDGIPLASPEQERLRWCPKMSHPFHAWSVTMLVGRFAPGVSCLRVTLALVANIAVGVGVMALQLDMLVLTCGLMQCLSQDGYGRACVLIVWLLLLLGVDNDFRTSRTRTSRLDPIAAAWLGAAPVRQ